MLFITAIILATVPAMLCGTGSPSKGWVDYEYYYLFAPTTNDTSVYTNLDRGQYSVVWNGEMMAGKGWNPGYPRTINYAGVYEATGDSWLSVTGWTRNPLVEYNVVEAYTADPSSGTVLGVATCNGFEYTLRNTTQVNQPTIDGVRTFQQLWSVRQGKTGSASGAVDLRCHFKAWAAVLGSFDYQLVAIRSKSGQGRAQLAVYQG